MHFAPAGWHAAPWPAARTTCSTQTHSRCIQMDSLRFCDRQPCLRAMPRARCCWQHPGHLMMAASAESQPPRDRPRLSNLSREIQQGFFELCVQNSGRPAAAALSQVVTAALQAFQAGYALDRLRLEMEHGTHTAIDAAGYRLMESERRYRTQWLDTVYITLQLLAGMEAGDDALAAQKLRPWADEDEALMSTVRRTLEGHKYGDARTSVKFDRSLATTGASGGAATELRVIAPQFVPISQLVLMTLKAREHAASR